MTKAVKKPVKKGASLKKSLLVSKKVKDHGNDPFFVKKAKAMEAVLRKHSLPGFQAQV